ncbi:hypothetical protein Tco_0691258 [Tanacetum coccineum]
MSATNQKLNRNGKGDTGMNSTFENIEKGECSDVIKEQCEKQKENEGFGYDLNGEQFPPINTGIENCEDTGDDDDSVVKAAKSMDSKEGCSSISCSEMEAWSVKELPTYSKVLMEAWCVKEISALASSLGKPLIMDEVTTRMCLTGVGRIGFARVLVEIDVEKEIKDMIEIIYKGKNVAEGTKIFVEISENDFKTVQNRRTRNEGFMQSMNHQGQYGYYGRQWTVGRNSNENNKKPNVGRFKYRKRMKEATNVKEMSVNNKEVQNDVGNTENKNNDTQRKDTTKEPKIDKNNSKKGELNEVSKSNRFTLLNELVDEDELIPNLNEREIVDKFVHSRINPTDKDM